MDDQSRLTNTTDERSEQRDKHNRLSTAADGSSDFSMRRELFFSAQRAALIELAVTNRFLKQATIHKPDISIQIPSFSPFFVP
jgi:hypothetical protein